jgi:hypothetical protein
MGWRCSRWTTAFHCRVYQPGIVDIHSFHSGCGRQNHVHSKYCRRISTSASWFRMLRSKVFSRAETAESSGRSTFIDSVSSRKTSSRICTIATPSSSSSIGSITTPSVSSIASCSAFWSIAAARARATEPCSRLSCSLRPGRPFMHAKQLVRTIPTVDVHEAGVTR